MKCIIVGGVAAGASAAARLRRLDETAEILLFERGPYISYANCGLPYHLGGIIPERDSLLVMSTESFNRRFKVDVRTESNVTAIDPVAKTVTVKGKDTTYTESYDKLLIATGSSPVMFDLPGLDIEKVFPFWTVPDMDRVLKKMTVSATRAVVVGAGFIGIELAENLRHRGLAVTLVELAPQVLPQLDIEMSSYLAQELRGSGVTLKLGRKVTAFETTETIETNRGNEYLTVLDDGEKIPADVVLMCVGVQPNNTLAKTAGLSLGPRGHIIVDSTLRTSNPDIFAAGDVIEVTDRVTMTPTSIPLAGPANKQGRIAAENMAGGHVTYSGSLGATVIKVGQLTAACCGLTERRLRQLNIPYHKIYTHPGSHASYYPGAAVLHTKLLFSPDGKILGTQIVGIKGVDKRVDVIATAIQCGKTAPELAELELVYAPPYNSAKDPVNFLGMIAGNVLQKRTDVIHADSIPTDAVLLDVREPAEFSTGTISGAKNIPLGQLRSRLGEIDKNRKLVVFCKVGLRGYVAERILKQHGLDCANLSGGFLTYQAFHVTPRPVTQSSVQQPVTSQPTSSCMTPQSCISPVNYRTLDVRTLSCPGPVVRLKKEVDGMNVGEELKLLAAGSFAPDLTNWIHSNGHELVSMEMKPDELEAVIRKKPENSPCGSSMVSQNDDAAIILFSNDLDKSLAALIVACGMAAAGSRVSIFFTFWGLSVLRKNPSPPVPKSVISRMFGWMLPKGPRKLTLSKMNMGGMGTMMMKHVMTRENVPTLDELLENARELGIQFIACEMAMNVMGLTREELIDVDSVAGVASFAAIAKNAGTTLFI